MFLYAKDKSKLYKEEIIMMNMIDRIIDWYEDDEQEQLRDTVEIWKVSSLVVMILLTVAFWFGHPEWILSKKCCKMIVRNCKED